MIFTETDCKFCSFLFFISKYILINKHETEKSSRPNMNSDQLKNQVETNSNRY